MAIVCKKCKYILTKMEMLGHLTGEIRDFVQETVVPFLQKRGYVENFLLGIANQQEIRCAHCFKYEGWEIIFEAVMDTSTDENNHVNITNTNQNSEEIDKK